MTKTIPHKQMLLMTGDVLLIAVSLYLAPILRFGILIDPGTVFSRYDILAVAIYLLVLYIFDFYNPDERSSKTGFLLRFALAIAVANVAGISVFYIFQFPPYGAGILAISGSLAFLLMAAWRFAFMRVIAAARPLKILILGAGRTGKSLYDYLTTRNDYEVVGFMDDDERKRETAGASVPVLSGTENLCSLVRQHGIDKIIVAITGQIKPEVFRNLVKAKFDCGVVVHQVPTFYEQVAGKIPVLDTTDMWLGFTDISGVERNVYNTKLKKVFDKAISVAGLILAAPIMILTALLIRLESRGPALYRQERVGWDEHLFELVKFRSMRTDAEANGAVWAVENDPRVTRIGRIIRRLRIDELPQMWNVLKGEMSFVGPRPERMAFVKDLKREIPYYTLRHSVRPGITGWAQVNYPYGASKEDALEKLQYDLYYIKNASILLDIQIIIRTIRVALFRKGAR
jgi:sugar transferase (PEP-CTERM system associated)